jgi:hypothetical protein
VARDTGGTLRSRAIGMMIRNHTCTGSKAIKGHQRSSKVIKGHPRPSEAIRGHQRQLTRLTSANGSRSGVPRCHARACPSRTAAAAHSR